jgi:hypothetical protein
VYAGAVLFAKGHAVHWALKNDLALRYFQWNTDARHGKAYSPTRFNGALGIVRRIFDIAAEHGYRVDKSAKFVDRRRLKPKELHLP